MYKKVSKALPTEPLRSAFIFMDLRSIALFQRYIENKFKYIFIFVFFSCIFSAGYGHCLHDVPRVKRYRKHIKRIQKKHAGSLYSANKQCELVYGREYHLCPYLVSCW